MGKLPLEGFKFAVYIGAPVLAVTYFQRPDVFRRIIENRNYIQYPPEDERSPEELLDALAKKKRTGGTVGTKITDAARGDITRMSDNSYTNGIINSSSRSTSTSSSSDGDAPSIPWRRYIFFGPRDDREALDKKRTKATE
jgi:hypothetical protein